MRRLVVGHFSLFIMSHIDDFEMPPTLRDSSVVGRTYLFSLAIFLTSSNLALGIVGGLPLLGLSSKEIVLVWDTSVWARLAREEG